MPMQQSARMKTVFFTRQIMSRVGLVAVCFLTLSLTNLIKTPSDERIGVPLAVFLFGVGLALSYVYLLVVRHRSRRVAIVNPEIYMVEEVVILDSEYRPSVRDVIRCVDIRHPERYFYFVNDCPIPEGDMDSPHLSGLSGETIRLELRPGCTCFD